jgi:hypothetical protein
MNPIGKGLDVIQPSNISTLLSTMNHTHHTMPSTSHVRFVYFVPLSGIGWYPLLVAVAAGRTKCGVLSFGCGL